MIIVSKYTDVLHPLGKYFQLVFLERYIYIYISVCMYILSQWSCESLKKLTSFQVY